MQKKPSLCFIRSDKGTFKKIWQTFTQLCVSVWKLSKDGYPLNFVPGASFLMQSDWLKKKADQSLHSRKEALETRLMLTKNMVKH